MVGPFIFFDQMGPAEFLSGQGIDVRPHPHIGLATVTYLHKGTIHHLDSLGTDHWIAPGDVNLMVAGHGITHSERVDGKVRENPHSLFGIQSWIALPEDKEDNPAAFIHAAADALPIMEGEGKQVRLILGSAYGETAPVETPSEMFYLDAVLQARAQIPLPDNHEDCGVYVVQGAVEVAGQRFDAGKMMVFRPGDHISLRAGDAVAQIMILGGATLNGPRHIWWNFVASSRDKIDAAKEAWRAGDWAHGRFKLPVGDTDEFMPLPGRQAPPLSA
jgi:redox-sensitive bicupin YhaK (pirin superfamily)